MYTQHHYSTHSQKEIQYCMWDAKQIERENASQTVSLIKPAWDWVRAGEREREGKNVLERESVKLINQVAVSVLNQGHEVRLIVPARDNKACNHQSLLHKPCNYLTIPDHTPLYKGQNPSHFSAAHTHTHTQVYYLLEDNSSLPSIIYLSSSFLLYVYYS